MKKNKVSKKKGIKVVEKIQAKENRPLFPRPAVFANKKKYNRKKYDVRKEIPF